MNTLARWARHIWLDAADARRLLGAAGLARLEQAVLDSEARHMGELRVCVEAGLSASALWRGVSSRARAVELFSHLKVWDTEHNNGVLIYLLLAEHAIEVVADRGLNRHVSAAQWQQLTAGMAVAFRQGDYEGGLNEAIAAVGQVLVRHFPLSGLEANPNELPDAPVVQ